MVEVFKTNVTDRDHARQLVELIHQSFSMYHANFDLDDCDKILRVACRDKSIQSSSLITLLRDFGYEAEVLSDDVKIYSAI